MSSSTKSPVLPNRALAADRRILAELEAKGLVLPGFIELFDRFEHAAFWIKDTQCRFLWVNTPFVLHNGMSSRSEVIGLTDFDLCEASMAAQYRLDDEKVLRGERIDSRIETVGRFDHSLRWCVTSKMPVRNRRGEIVGTAGISFPYSGDAGRMRDESPLSPAMQIISKRFKEPFDRRELAGACGMSLRDFHRKFRESYHLSPHDYVRQLRVRASCHALVYSRKNLARIADEFGFSDQSHFSREFRRFVGEPPGSYRAQHRP